MYRTHRRESLETSATPSSPLQPYEADLQNALENILSDKEQKHQNLQKISDQTSLLSEDDYKQMKNAPHSDVAKTLVAKARCAKAEDVVALLGIILEVKNFDPEHKPALVALRATLEPQGNVSSSSGAAKRWQASGRQVLIQLKQHREHARAFQQVVKTWTKKLAEQEEELKQAKAGSAFVAGMIETLTKNFLEVKDNLNKALEEKARLREENAALRQTVLAEKEAHGVTKEEHEQSKKQLEETRLELVEKDKQLQEAVARVSQLQEEIKQNKKDQEEENAKLRANMEQMNERLGCLEKQNEKK